MLQTFFFFQLPKVFKKGHNYRLYRPDVIFENNFSKQPKTTV